MAVSTPVQSDRPPIPPYRFTVEQFHRMITGGVFAIDDHCELLEGWTVQTSVLSPPHACALSVAFETIRCAVPAGWLVRTRSNVTTNDSEPRPDLTVVRGPARRYMRRHPGPADIGLILEIADAAYVANRDWKKRVYARAGIPIYWIVDLVKRRVEVCSKPKAGKTPSYRQHREYIADDLVPLVLAGRSAGTILVQDLWC